NLDWSSYISAPKIADLIAQSQILSGEPIVA
ncbi:unnamed protein product, partial [Rotaria sordida]